MVGENNGVQAQLAERDRRIAEFEAQIAEAARIAEAAEALRDEIAELEAQDESERVDFKLQLVGVRNAKAACALLDDHNGDEADFADELANAERLVSLGHGFDMPARI